MKILYIYWGTQLNDVLWGLVELGEDVEQYPETINILKYDEAQRDQLSTYLKNHHYDLVISNSFLPTVSDACQERGVKYAAWIFDSPQIGLYMKPALNENNYIFVFDRKQLERMKSRGIPHLYYLPLAANITKVSLLELPQIDLEQFSREISFVGKLYEKNCYNGDCNNFPKDVKAALDEIILQKSLHWSENLTVFDSISSEISDRLLPYSPRRPEYDIDMRYYHELCYIVGKVSEIDRVCALNALAMYHRTDIFTDSNTLALENVNQNKYLLYNDELPKVYHLSKINLNLTMRSIETGAPQRIFDIMACGGFLMSNYQEELEELFKPDHEIVLFRSIEELVEKADYYLKHEKERLQIALNGFRKVQESYTYPMALKKILDVVRE